jgi:signal transduction histidine kinase
MTPKSAHLLRSRHLAGISASAALATASGPRAALAATGAGRPGPHRTTGALALAPVFPLALTGPSLATAGDTGTPSASRPASDRSGLWLRNAAAGLCVLAAAAAAVSFTAQYRMAETARHLPAIAALEAAIPDAAALVFACLGIALALHGRRALRARALNLASVAASVFMNAIAAEPGWRNLAIWAMPPVAYALASDTLIGVVRARSLARHQHLASALAHDAATPLAALGGVVLWLLRLTLAPASTVSGFRAWVLEECPVAPGRRAPKLRSASSPHPRKATKTARFLDLVTERHGSLASIPLHRVAGISADLAPQLDLNAGAARTALRKAVLSARNGDPR